MLLTSEHDLVVILGVAAALLLTLAIGAGVLASLKSFQVRQFQDLLFKAERKIDTLERRMFNVLNAVPVALVETDTTGKFTFANKAAHQLLGRKDSELLGLRFHSATWGISYPDGRMVPPDLMPIARTLRGQTVKGFQHMIVNHGTKEKVLVSVTSMPIMNGNGEVIGSTAAMVEIESTAGEGVDDLGGVWRGHWFGAATVPFWGLNTKGQILDINNAALDAFDLKREDVLGKNWTQVFVDDADFQRAIDYLGDSMDETTPNTEAAVRLGLTGQPSLVSAWAVRTHEGGEQGLTVMAQVGVIGEAHAPQTAGQETDMAAKPVSELTDDDAQELEDLRNAEQALSRLGIGVWQYDPDAETIVEDAGMRTLIGREYEGGPTLISAEDQARADVEFSRILSGASDALNMDIRVIHKDGTERWITLKGHAFKDDKGARDIFGVAFDSTDFKSSQPAPEVVVAAPAVSEADLEAARKEARQQALDEARKEYEAALAAAKSTEPDVYGWNDTAQPEPVIIREADPAVVEENEALKARIAALESVTLEAAATAAPEIVTETITETVVVREPDPAVVAENEALKAQLEELQVDLRIADTTQTALREQIAEHAATPAPEADTSAHDARIAALEAQLREASEARNELQVQMSEILMAPRMVEVADDRDDKIQALSRDLEAAQAAQSTLKAQLDALAAAPAPQPDTSEWEAKVAEARFEMGKWQAAYHDAQAKLAAVPPAPTVNIDALTARLDELQQNLNQSQAQQGEMQQGLSQAQAAQNAMQARLDQVSAALANARKYETVGRLTGDVAQDFAQMLHVINGALEVMSKQADSEQIKRLSEAALAAGKRGERLTRQLQAFQSEDF